MKETSFEFWRHCVFHGGGVHDTDWQSLISYLIELFVNPKFYFAEYHDLQIAKGMYRILSPTELGDIGVLMHEDVLLDEKRKCLRGVCHFFRDYLSLKCNNSLRQHSNSEVIDLNFVCFMWWDIAPVYPAKKYFHWGAEFDLAVLMTMKEVLSYGSMACQESALHGLGHWELDYPNEVKNIIDEYLNTRCNSNELREYAVNAKSGLIQ